MSLDPYAPCPCGSGKKLKFCCADLRGEIEKVQRMVEGEQFNGALEHLTALLAKYPGRETLLALRAGIETQLGRYDDAEKTVTELLEKSPRNAIGNAERAILTSFQDGESRDALDALMRALEFTGEQLPQRVYEAMGAVAGALLHEGHFLGARELLARQAALAQGDDPRPITLLRRILSSPQVPIPLKAELQPRECKRDVAWKERFDSAFQNLVLGVWDQAESTLVELSQEFPAEPEIWHNLACVRCWRGDRSGAVQALRGLAALDLPQEDAVDALALAELLAEDDDNDKIEIRKNSYVILEREQLDATLTAEPRIAEVPLDPSQFDPEDGPAPRASYWVLDQAPPEPRDDLTIEDIPNAIAQLYLYGRETDREARLEMFAAANGELESAEELLKQISGTAWADNPVSEVEDRASRSIVAMGWTWLMPRGIKKQQASELRAEKRRRMVSDVWTSLSLPALDGKTPTEAAADPNLRLRVLAAIQNMELTAKRDPLPPDFNALREQLGLPAAGLVDPTGFEESLTPSVRLARLDTEKPTPEELFRFFTAATLLSFSEAVLHLGQAFFDRDVFADQPNADANRAAICGEMSRAASNPDQAREYLKRAGEYARAAGESPARWDLEEMDLFLREGYPDEAQRKFNEMQADYQHDEQVMSQLMELLIARGVVSPDEFEDAPGMAPTAASAQQGIWTPGGAAEPAGESKLWVPGMD